MTTLRERVAGERRRLKSVRELLTTAVNRTADGDGAFVPFYIAIGEYMEASMERLHAQDIRMGDMIREKLGPPDATAKQALMELDERLAGNQALLTAFSAARRTLEVPAPAAGAVGQFEAISRAYSRYIVQNMGHHGATTELAARLFSPADWEDMAHVSETDARREEQLYDQVFARLPAPLADLQRAG